MRPENYVCLFAGMTLVGRNCSSQPAVPVFIMVQKRVHKGGQKTNFSGFYSMIKAMKDGLVDTKRDMSNEYSKAFDAVAIIYRGFLRGRFKERSAGNGEWAPIKDSTKKWRKWKHGVTHDLILFVTETLYESTGSYEKRTKYGVTVGMAANAHPDFKGSTQMLERIHASQGRPVMEEAPQEAIDLMDGVMRRAHHIEVAKANKAVK